MHGTRDRGGFLLRAIESGRFRDLRKSQGVQGGYKTGVSKVGNKSWARRVGTGERQKKSRLKGVLLVRRIVRGPRERIIEEGERSGIIESTLACAV